MKARLVSIALVLLATSTGYGQTRIDNRRSSRNESDYSRSEFIGTDISPQRCKRTDTLNENLRDCGGVAGYRLLYSGPEEKPEIIIVTPAGKRFLITYWNLDSANFVSLSNSVQWIFIRSQKQITPLALILQATIKPEEFSRFNGPYTIIVKLTPREVCTVGRDPTGPDSAMDNAALIDMARFRKCVRPDDVVRKDWMGVVFGLVAKGQYEQAKSVISQMKSSGERIGAYTTIAQAQAEAGDIVAARTTLKQGLEEAVRNETGIEDEFTVKDAFAYQNNVISIAYGFARTGLYNDLSATVKLIDADHIADAMVAVAKIQGASPSRGGRGDLEAAKITFKEAIQIELAREDTTAADNHFVNIVRAQAEVGLVTEARQTIAFIKSPSARQAAEHSIAWFTDKPE